MEYTPWNPRHRGDTITGTITELVTATTLHGKLLTIRLADLDEKKRGHQLSLYLHSHTPHDDLAISDGEVVTIVNHGVQLGLDINYQIYCIITPAAPTDIYWHYDPIHD